MTIVDFFENNSSCRRSSVNFGGEWFHNWVFIEITFGRDVDLTDWLIVWELDQQLGEELIEFLALQMAIFRNSPLICLRVSQLSTLLTDFLKTVGSFVGLTENIGVRRVFLIPPWSLHMATTVSPLQQPEIITAPSLPLPFASRRSLVPHLTCFSSFSRVFACFRLLSVVRLFWSVS